MKTIQFTLLLAAPLALAACSAESDMPSEADDMMMPEPEWAHRGEEMCFDPDGDGEDQQERCWIQGEPSDDGSFTTTRVDGSESYMVTPLGE